MRRRLTSLCGYFLLTVRLLCVLSASFLRLLLVYSSSSLRLLGVYFAVAAPLSSLKEHAQSTLRQAW